MAGLLETVESAQRAHDFYLVLDQAEEYFVYHEEEGAFDADLARLVGDPLRVNVLLSLREDSLARLDRFKPRIPAVYANSLRLDRLDRSAGRAAIVRPIERWNELQGELLAVEPALVEAVLDGVGAGRIEQGVGGLGAVEGDGRPSAIEAPYLQLVMQRLWEVERAAGSEILRAGSLTELGGARQIVADHLERAVDALTPDQRDVAAQLFTYLVTPSGTKIAHELPDLAEYSGVTEDEAAPVVESLARDRILRPDEAGRTEIFHDVLAGEVLAWRRRHAAERALDQERADARRRHRRLAWVAGGAVGAFLAMTLLAVFAFSQRTEAREQAQEAKAHELEALATAELDADPELSLLLALEAVRLAPTVSAEETLRRALRTSRVRAVLRAGQPLLGAAPRGDDVLTATADGTVVVGDSRTGRRRDSISTRERATSVSFAENGTVLLAGRDGKVRIVRPDGRVSAIPGVVDARGAELSADASMAAVIGADVVRLIDVGSGDVLQTFAHPGVLSATIARGNGKEVVTGGADEAVRIWDARTGELLRTLPGQRGRPVAVALSPGGTFVASASRDGMGRVWRVSDGGLVAPLSGHTNSLTDVAFSADGEQIVTASRDGTARVWKADTGAPLIELSGHRNWVRSAAFTGGVGSPIVTASTDGKARVWDAVVQPELLELANLGAPVTLMGFLRGDQIHAVTRDGASVLDAVTGEPINGGPLPPPPVRRSRRVVGPDGTSATIHGNTIVLRVDGRTTILKGHRDRVSSASFSPDGTLLVTAGRDHDARTWDVATGKWVRVLPHTAPVRDARFSPDGRWIVTAASTAGLWDARDGSLVVRLRGHDGALTSADFDPTGRTIVTGGVDGTVRTYVCEICGGLDELVELAERRLAATGRELTAEERELYLS